MKNSNRRGAYAAVNIVSLVLLVGAAVFAFINVYELKDLLSKYMKYIVLGLAGVSVIMAIATLLVRKSKTLTVIKSVLCAILAIGLVYGGLKIPEYKGKFERAVVKIPEEGQQNINFYVLKDSSFTNLKDIVAEKVGIVGGLDADYQDYALRVASNELDGRNLDTVEYEDIYTAVENLYAGNVKVIMMNQSYADIIADNDDFLDFESKTRTVYTCIQKTKLSYDTTKVSDITSNPFVVLVGGKDNWNYASLEKMESAGRTDVNLCMVVNPNTHQLLMVTIPRDSYLPLGGNTKKMDKLTHATVFSISTWITTVSNLLDVDINYFVRINFSSLVNIVDVLGGLDIYNPSEFSTKYVYDMETKEYYPHTFEAGNLHLDGEHALAYVRERKYEGIGDYGRNKHQAIVLKAIIDEVTSVKGIMNFGNLMDAVKGTFVTSMDVNEIYDLAQKQLEDMRRWDMVTYSISGTSTKATSYAMGVGRGPKYSVVKLKDESVDTARDMIKRIMNNEVLTQQAED